MLVDDDNHRGFQVATKIDDPGIWLLLQQIQGFKQQKQGDMVISHGIPQQCVFFGL
jgi:hypothetical protein